MFLIPVAGQSQVLLVLVDLDAAVGCNRSDELPGMGFPGGVVHDCDLHDVRARILHEHACQRVTQKPVGFVGRDDDRDLW